MTRFEVSVEAGLGGRWTSLRDPRGREWLWARPDPARALVQPGDAFVDVGGLEECFPTIGANPDHGVLWCRPWSESTEDGGLTRHAVVVGDTALSRSITCVEREVVVDYELRAPAGRRFIWAAHALLELAVGARIDADPGPARAWPDHSTLVETTWPEPLGIDYAYFGPDDGSAMFCLLPGRDEVRVHDGGDTLRFRLQCEGQPVSVGLWRNLSGYPWSASPRYRNIGVEPMLGNVFDLDAAAEGDAAVVPSTGSLRWRLSIDNG